MASLQRRIGAPECVILIGALMFMAMLWLSAVYDPTIRWLHFFQAWMYIAVIVLALRTSRWGYFIGISIGMFWIYSCTFVSSFFRSGLIHLGRWMEGLDFRADQILAVPAWTGNLLIVIGCLWAYGRMRHKAMSDVTRLVVAFALSTAFLWADMALFQPRYLALFTGLLHPHAP